ncbi:MAG: alpha/beta hydrolase [Planctomycetota bacterium]
MPTPNHAAPSAAKPNRLLLWPGLAADHRLFGQLLAHLPQAGVPAMIEPEPNEPLRDYALRYAETLRSEIPESGRYAVGGFSFGGQLAMELAAALDPKPLGIVLICGVRGTHQISDAFNRQQRLGSMIPSFIAKKVYVPFARSFARRDRLDPASAELLVAMARDIDPAFLNWSSLACATWPGPPDNLGIPIRHVHGELDQIIPDVRSEADVTISGARHLISLTHPREVADFIQRSLESFLAEQADGR